MVIELPDATLCDSALANRLTIGEGSAFRGVNCRLTSLLTLKVGDEVTVSGPFGEFTYDPGEATHLTLVAGGSGITPVLSILQTALASDRHSRVHLIYANAHPEAEMFRWLIKALEAQYSGRFCVTRIYQHAPGSWQGLTGHLTSETLRRLVERGRRRHRPLLSLRPRRA